MAIKFASSMLVAAALSFVVFTNAAVVTVNWVQPPIGGDNVTPTTTTLPRTTQSGYSFDRQATTIVSAIGPADSGLTKYEFKLIQSRVVLYRPETTQTLFSEPVTAIYTVEQGSGSILREYGDPYHTVFADGSTLDVIGNDFDCTLDDEKKIGVCKGANLFADVTEVVSGTQTVLSTRTATMSTTFTGSVYPMATLGAPSGANRRSIPATSLIITLAAVVCGVCIAI